MRRFFKSMSPRTWITGTAWLLVIAVCVGGYTSQLVLYNRLLGLYTQQAEQLRENGIEPNTPSPAKVAQAGPQGDTGATGERGEKGDPGNEGPSPTVAELVQAFTLYCQTYDCKGTTGATGATGADGQTIVGPPGSAGATGATGRGIASVTCVMEPDFSTAFRFTFTDSTTTDITASCLPA